MAPASWLEKKRVEPEAVQKQQLIVDTTEDGAVLQEISNRQKVVEAKVAAS